MSRTRERRAKARKADELRTRHARVAATAYTPIRPLNRDPYTGANPCQGCNGAGVTGERVLITELPDGLEDVELMLPVWADAICPTCWGCGREHFDANGDELPEPGCRDYEHDQFIESNEAADELRATMDPAQWCDVCYGRRWFELPSHQIRTARHVRANIAIPCGCRPELLSSPTTA